MGSLFNMDNAFFSFMGKVWDMICLSMVWAVLSCYCLYFLLVINPPESLQSISFILTILLQGLTIGPATTALYYSVVKVIRRERNYAIRSFFHSFKLNFKISAIASEIFLIAAYIMWMDFQYATTAIEEGSSFGNIVYIGALAISVILVMMLLFIFPVLSRFTLNVLGLFKTAFFISMRHFITTIGLLIIVAVFAFTIVMIPPLIILVPAVCCLVMSFLIERVFKKYMPAVMEATGVEENNDQWYLGK